MADTQYRNELVILYLPHFVQQCLRLVLVILEIESQLHSVASHAFAGRQKGSQGQIFQMMKGEWNLLFHFSHSAKPLPLDEAKR
jgi:hypothetical protein